MISNSEIIVEIIKELRQTNSLNKKKEILSKHRDNVYFKKLLNYTYNPYKVYFIKNIKEIDIPTDVYICFGSDFGKLFALLDNLENGIYTGNKAREMVYSLMKENNFSEFILPLILKKNLDCGISVSTINRVFGKNFIPEFKIAAASGIDSIDNIKYPAIIQMKGDGKRVIIKYNLDNKITFFSRSGKIEENLMDNNYIISEVLNNLVPGFVYDGETIVYNKELTLPLSRKVSNGLLNRKDFPDEFKSRTKILLWDMIPIDVFDNKIKPSLKYHERLDKLRNLLTNTNQLEMIETYVVDSYEEARKIANEYIKNSYEGAIIKNIDYLYESKRTKNMIKIKAENEIDLKITGINEGTGRNKNLLGAITCESSDGRIVATVGSGLSDFDRKNLFNKNIIGKIVTVKYNELIKNSKDSKLHLYLPRFIEIRDDKDEADSLNKIINEGVKF